jgi:hypothetical protein
MKFFIIAIFITIIQIPNLTYAYNNMGYRWYGNPTFKIAPNMGSGNNCDEFITTVSWRNDFNCALEGWNNLNASYLNMYNSTNDENDTDRYDFENEVAWDSSLSPSTLGATWVNDIGDTIYEADITFNPNPSTVSISSWVSGAVPPSTFYYQTVASFRVVALHEIGHARGLGHDDTVPAIMNSFYYGGGWYRGKNYPSNNAYYGRMWPHADDVAGDHAIYPNTSIGRDLAVLNSKNVSGAYFSVDPVLINGNLLSTSVCAGGDNFIRVEYTVENRGNEMVFPIVEVFLSTNKWISPSDISIGGRAHVLLPYLTETRNYDFFIPSGINPGVYFVGVFIDPDDYITGEQSEDYNNGIDFPVGFSIVGAQSSTLTILPNNNPACQ